MAIEANRLFQKGMKFPSCEDVKTKNEILENKKLYPLFAAPE